jgi:hypothetical protein
MWNIEKIHVLMIDEQDDVFLCGFNKYGAVFTDVLFDSYIFTSIEDAVNLRNIIGDRFKVDTRTIRVTIDERDLLIKSYTPRIVCEFAKISNHRDTNYFSQSNEPCLDNGFIDQFTNFYTPEEAMGLVKATNQNYSLIRNKNQDKILYIDAIR